MHGGKKNNKVNSRHEYFVFYPELGIESTLTGSTAVWTAVDEKRDGGQECEGGENMIRSVSEGLSIFFVA